MTMTVSEFDDIAMQTRRPKFIVVATAPGMSILRCTGCKGKNPGGRSRVMTDQGEFSYENRLYRKQRKVHLRTKCVTQPLSRRRKLPEPNFWFSQLWRTN